VLRPRKKRKKANKDVKKAKANQNNDNSKTNLRKGSFNFGDMRGYAPPQKGVLRKASTISATWANALVPYSFASGQLTSSAQKVILGAMEYISSKTCVRFKERTTEADYVDFIKDSGCYSYVGRVGGKQPISIGTGCELHGTCIHEILHALGFFHEHMRSDRDSYITVDLNNAQPSAKDQFTKLPASVNKLYTLFDYLSIMMYGSNSFSKNGMPTMVAKQKGVHLTNPYDKKGMTESDIINIKKMYNCP